MGHYRAATYGTIEEIIYCMNIMEMAVRIRNQGKEQPKALKAIPEN